MFQTEVDVRILTRPLPRCKVAFEKRTGGFMIHCRYEVERSNGMRAICVAAPGVFGAAVA